MAGIEVARAINSAHQRILTCEASYNDEWYEVMYAICDGPYGLECAYALADRKTAHIWFASACAHAQWPLIRWLMLMYGEDLARSKTLALDAACGHKREAVARWLIGRFQFGAGEATRMIHLTADNGMFRLTKRILIRYGLYLAGQNMLLMHKRYAFKHACAHKCIWFIKWLDKKYELTINDACYQRMDAFTNACENGHWSLARWMAARFGFTRGHIRAANWRPLAQTCQRGQLYVLRWLVEYFHLVARDIRAENNLAFVYACEYGHLGVAQWLTDRFHLTARDARSPHNWALLEASYSGHIDVARWLVERFGLGREGSRVSYVYQDVSVYGLDADINTVKWFITTFEPCRQQEHKWYTAIIEAAADKNRVEFAWWIVRRLSIAPYMLGAAVEWYRRRADVTELNIMNVNRWFATYVAEFEGEELSSEPGILPESETQCEDDFWQAYI